MSHLIIWCSFTAREEQDSTRAACTFEWLINHIKLYFLIIFFVKLNVNCRCAFNFVWMLKKYTVFNSTQDLWNNYCMYVLQQSPISVVVSLTFIVNSFQFWPKIDHLKIMIRTYNLKNLIFLSMVFLLFWAPHMSK